MSRPIFRAFTTDTTVLASLVLCCWYALQGVQDGTRDRYEWRFGNGVYESHHHHRRCTSPSRVNVFSSPSLTSSVRFFVDNRSISPDRSVIVSRKNHPASNVKRTCMCSPTTHPLSFRCSFHKNVSSSGGHSQTVSFPSIRLNMRRSAMANSLVRIGGVEGELVKRALTTLIRPSSHQQRRIAAFIPRSSRLAVMSKVDDA
ncbi:hypothetical protein SDJN03_01514, partial [Cucurbita argyrosperma subsp. sororia]